MNILIIGGGGREHAIAKLIAKNPNVSKIYALPGNGGISQLAECVKISAEDIDGIISFAKTHPVDFGEYFILCGRNVVFRHQFFGEYLAAFDYCGFLVRAETLNAFSL